jgi:PAS domain S-box-containing protein
MLTPVKKEHGPNDKRENPMDGVEQATAALLEELDVLRARVVMLEQEETLQEGPRTAALSSEVGIAFVQNLPLRRILQQCAQSLVDHLDAAFARIWTLNPATQVLELQASAGQYTHLDGAHSRVPVGSLKIGLIAAERLPYVTNAVIGDPRVSEQEWAKREGMVAFAGYPLLLAEKVVGVMALFARKPLSPAVLDAMASVANMISLGIDHTRVEDERKRLLLVEQHARVESEAARQRLSSILDNLMDGFMLFDTEWRYTYINAQAGPFTGKPREELLGKNVWEEFPALVNSSFYQQYHEALLRQEPVAFEAYSALLQRWFDIRAYPVPDGLAVYFRDITGRKQAEDERIRLLEDAQQSRDQAEAALQVRNVFLSSMSHDLKTPLTTIKGVVQIWQRRSTHAQAIDVPQLLKGLDLIESATRKMAVMIDDVLDVAQLQSGQELELNISQLDVVTLVQQVAAVLQASTTRHRIQIEAAVPHAVISGDPVRLDRVITNVLTNAIKYSPHGGTITVKVSQEECEDKTSGFAVIEVTDPGLGIPAADLPHIFDQFRRATNVAGRILGTGIGLASCLHIVQQHGGTMTATSLEGSGTSFFVRLPLERLHPSERSIRSREQTSSSSVEGSNRATRK